MNSLTPRERQVVNMVARGLRTKVIAHELGITYGTAKLHIHNAYAKLGINSRIELVHWKRRQPVLLPVEEIDWMQAAE